MNCLRRILEPWRRSGGWFRSYIGGVKRRGRTGGGGYSANHGREAIGVSEDNDEFFEDVLREYEYEERLL